MSIDLTVQYPGKVGAATADYPYGVPQNITTPSDGTGTPWEAAIVKDTEGFKQALLKAASIVPSGTPEKVGASEYLQSLVEIAAGRAIVYDETGVADAYILDVKANQEGPRSYYEGMVVEFIPGNSNIASSTINVNGIGLKVIFKPRGTAILDPDNIIAGRLIKLRYDGTVFQIVPNSEIVTGVVTSVVTASGGSATITIAHGFGSDIVDFGCTISSSLDNSVVASMTAANGAFNIFGDQTAGAVPITVAPATGFINIVRRNHHTVDQGITVRYWVRKRY